VAVVGVAEGQVGARAGGGFRGGREGGLGVVCAAG
jgi:hypothetical protein